MFKRFFFIAFVLCLFASFVQAEPASEQELPRWIEVSFAAADDSTGGASKAFCSANCQGQGSASCSGSTCSAVDRNCAAGQRGYAQCGSTRYYCNPCPAPNCSADLWCNPQCGSLDPDCGLSCNSFCVDENDCAAGGGFCYMGLCCT